MASRCIPPSRKQKTENPLSWRISRGERGGASCHDDLLIAYYPEKILHVNETSDVCVQKEQGKGLCELPSRRRRPSAIADETKREQKRPRGFYPQETPSGPSSSAPPAGGRTLLTGFPATARRRRSPHAINRPAGAPSCRQSRSPEGKVSVRPALGGG